MVDSVLIAIAAVVARQASGLLASGVRSAAAALAKAVGERFRSDPEAEAAFTDAATDPEDEESVQRLAEAIDRATKADPDFEHRLRTLWASARTEGTASHGGVVNQISGNVGGNVVQARDIHGGINFGK
ncbi:hypothetical protein [Actinoalloteichus hymeniacidonis]|uniref:Uncharacterized protein n=1 Tax=Actinoalloteichus hymeniacidonis TaxID=340345 RepID=A0AAC9HS97_9PSEU|nr:hypothetical protein [Actinoalloteichus hymeniacidonis]AOS64478.1 hypothetical protein TL08_18415 [Actinoalloteichus hymeniacidonis]MBB5907452.1 hypothetical protein [Actinoalloteichus hymeniacidonis]